MELNTELYMGLYREPGAEIFMCPTRLFAAPERLFESLVKVRLLLALERHLMAYPKGLGLWRR